MMRITFLLVISSITQILCGQILYIDSINYIGNKKTKNYIIRRELDFKVNDSTDMAVLTQGFSRNRSRILNTGLFKDVRINIKRWNTETNHITIDIVCDEGWYIYPVPIFELADRNFNVWWDEFNGSLKRTNYGIKFIHTNLSGQADALKITLQGGYSQKADLEYAWPYWGKDRSWRFTSTVFYSRNREAYYNTINNKLVFHKALAEDEYSLNRFRINTSLEHRTTLQLFQSIRIEYNANQTIPEISEELNPDFFLNKKIKQNYLSLRYEFKYDDRDLKYYPSNGRLAEIHITKEGIGKPGDVNTLTTSLQLQQFIPWGKKHNAGIMVKAKGSIIRSQPPYYNSKAIGFGDNYLKGYEYYVVDGLDYFFLRFRERFIFLDKNIQFLPKTILGIKSKPLKMGVSVHGSTGYVNNVFYSKTNTFGNRWLWSSGISMEVLMSNTSMIQLDWSINHLKQSGVYLHFKEDF